MGTRNGAPVLLASIFLAAALGACGGRTLITTEPDAAVPTGTGGIGGLAGLLPSIGVCPPGVSGADCGGMLGLCRPDDAGAALCVCLGGVWTCASAPAGGVATCPPTAASGVPCAGQGSTCLDATPGAPSACFCMAGASGPTWRCLNL